jgi:hypothetical protein
MLHDDRHVGLEHRRVVGVARDRTRIVEIVEAVTRYGPTGSRSAKKIVIATCASRSVALRMQAVSCEISVRSDEELSDGI